MLDVWLIFLRKFLNTVWNDDILGQRLMSIWDHAHWYIETSSMAKIKIISLWEKQIVLWFKLQLLKSVSISPIDISQHWLVLWLGAE